MGQLEAEVVDLFLQIILSDLHTQLVRCLIVLVLCVAELIVLDDPVLTDRLNFQDLRLHLPVERLELELEDPGHAPHVLLGEEVRDSELHILVLVDVFRDVEHVGWVEHMMIYELGLYEL